MEGSHIDCRAGVGEQEQEQEWRVHSELRHNTAVVYVFDSLISCCTNLLTNPPRTLALYCCK